ncbi:hypothetical protein M404DRAFT_265867 [Pisolithus tinctorius Marx 270]|uniref:Uncharacterized protein n=1 Tax=Pisolithus tinctorius Marx 270 TaxID=870435 RepID=A0A0C3KIN3_PISTI|nr:hypothetical protein M404DRAFT_265867 [Pisolithus tinctorius Marx 270]
MCESRSTFSVGYRQAHSYLFVLGATAVRELQCCYALHPGTSCRRRSSFVVICDNLLMRHSVGAELGVAITGATLFKAEAESYDVVNYIMSLRASVIACHRSTHY